MQKVWDLAGIKDLETNPDHAEAKNLVIWYWDRWLPYVALVKYWGEKQRHFQTPVEHIIIRKRNDDGTWGNESKVAVTVTSEAYGWLTYANNRDKWLNTLLKKQKEGKNAKFPTKDKEGNKEPDYDKYQPKYTLSGQGQVKFGGWKDEAYDEFERFKGIITEIRKVDRENGDATFKATLQMVRNKHGITKANPTEPSKRGRSKVADNESPPSKRLNITIIDE